MTIAEYEAYITAVNDIEERIENDNEYPVIEDHKIKKCCKITLELSKIIIRYILSKFKSNALEDSPKPK